MLSQTTWRASTSCIDLNATGHATFKPKPFSTAHACTVRSEMEKVIPGPAMTRFTLSRTTHAGKAALQINTSKLHQVSYQCLTSISHATQCLIACLNNRVLPWTNCHEVAFQQMAPSPIHGGCSPAYLLQITIWNSRITSFSSRCCINVASQVTQHVISASLSPASSINIKSPASVHDHCPECLGLPRFSKPGRPSQHQVARTVYCFIP